MEPRSLSTHSSVASANPSPTLMMAGGINVSKVEEGTGVDSCVESNLGGKPQLSLTCLGSPPQLIYLCPHLTFSSFSLFSPL